ncbi:hypothetical protein GYA37_03500 [candidate division WWE3 bacterium]|uniref:Uncharacterized protein n=1 Tax=candidate division WWE3 bacterium TaxID=2053526 RepID=A0A7X9HSY8_UNCKA|nr:hypothetical protein [candidate division WWE3 bacterium]
MKVRRLLLSLLLLFVSNIIVYETVHLNDKKVIDGINQTLSDTKNRMKGSKIFYYNVSTEYYGFYRVLVLTPLSDTATIRVRMIGNGGGVRTCRNMTGVLS